MKSRLPLNQQTERPPLTTFRQHRCHLLIFPRATCQMATTQPTRHLRCDPTAYLSYKLVRFVTAWQLALDSTLKEYRMSVFLCPKRWQNRPFSVNRVERRRCPSVELTVRVSQILSRMFARIVWSRVCLLIFIRNQDRLPHRNQGKDIFTGAGWSALLFSACWPLRRCSSPMRCPLPMKTHG